MDDVPLPEYWNQPVSQVDGIPPGGSVVKVNPQTAISNVLAYFSREYMITCTGLLLSNANAAYFSYGYAINSSNQLIFRGNAVCECTWTIVHRPSASS